MKRRCCASRATWEGRFRSRCARRSSPPIRCRRNTAAAPMSTSRPSRANGCRSCARRASSMPWTYSASTSPSASRRPSGCSRRRARTGCRSTCTPSSSATSAARSWRRAKALHRGARLLDWLQPPPDRGPRGGGPAMAEPDSLKLGSRPLRLADLRRVYQGPVSVQIDAAALGAVRDAHAVTVRLAAADAPAYGINTGFGLLANTRIPPAQRTLLQRNIILSHSCGVGPLLDDAIVRLTLVLKLASLLQGFSGVSPELVRFLERLINAGLCPCVPAQGSVGASGV